MQTSKNMQWNSDEIEQHLKSAVDTLTPDIFDRLDLSVPQAAPENNGQEKKETSKVIHLSRRLRAAAILMAACLCLVIGIGAFNTYANRRVDSIIGIDVNPSIELTVNRKDRILSAEALNSDGEEILDGMDLRNVQMDIAVNAVIGSMVRHGYLDEIKNAILVTVSNDNSEKAAEVRQNVVSEIEDSLEEHNVSAIVYNQEATGSDELDQIAEKYNISYGKAYFLQELIAENGLSEDDMATLAGMTMGEIAQYISDESLSVSTQTGSGDSAEAPIETEVVTTAAASTEETAVTSSEAASSEESTAGSEAAEVSSADQETKAKATEAPATTQAATESSSETQEEIDEGEISIDDADYDGEILTITFDDEVTWKSVSVSIEDEDGESYPAKVIDTDSDSCEIEVTDLPGNTTCRFTIAGVSRKGSDKVKSVSGTFDTPDIAEGAEANSYLEDQTQSADEDEETEETAVTEKTTEGTKETIVETESAAETSESQ